MIGILSVCILLKEKNILTLLTNGKEDFIHEFCSGGERTGLTPNTEKAAGNLPLRSRLRGQQWVKSDSEETSRVGGLVLNQLNRILTDGRPG